MIDPLAHLTPDRRPHRWRYYLLGGLGLLVLVAALAPGGPNGGYGAKAGRYALTPVDLTAAGTTDALGNPQQRWVATQGPVDFGRVFAAARALPGVSAPDDRHVAAFRAADGSAEVFQVTVLYDDAAKAESLVNRSAVSSLSTAFGLTSAPAELPGAVDARSWTGPDVDALSFRTNGVVVFVGTRGVGAPPPGVLAAAVMGRLAADPPATTTAGGSTD